MYDFTSLRVWQAAQELYLLVHPWQHHPYFIRNRFMKDQLFRAVLSIQLNLAEGAGRGRNKEFAFYIRISRGSLDEVRSLVLLLERLEPGIFETEKILSELATIRKSINSLHSKVQSSNSKDFKTS